EGMTGLLFAYSYWEVGFSLELFIILLFVGMLMILFVTDSVYMIIPNKVLLFFLPLFIVMRFFSPLDPWYDAILGAVIGFLILAIIIVLSKGGMGGGDMKLFIVIGIVLGWKGTMLTLLLASVLGFFTSGILILFKKVSRKQS